MKILKKLSDTDLNTDRSEGLATRIPTEVIYMSTSIRTRDRLY